jgi:putative DNA primase/helicase
MWDLLEQWYQDNGTLSYEEGSNGKRKATWNEQPRKSDPNVKAVNQVIARFTVLFPKAKVVTVAKEGGGKPRMGLQGIGFVTTISPDPSPDFTQFITQVSPNLSPKESLQDKDFHPSHPISHDCGEKNKTNDESTTCPPETSLSSPNSEEMAKLGDLGEKADQVSNFGCSTGCKSGDATSELGDGSGEASVFKVSDRVRVHCPGSQRDDKTGVVQQIQNDGIHAIVWLDDASIRHDLRRWECHLSWLEVLRE